MGYYRTRVRMTYKNLSLAATRTNARCMVLAQVMEGARQLRREVHRYNHFIHGDFLDVGPGGCCVCNAYRRSRPNEEAAVLTYDDWGDGPQCTHCGQLQDDKFDNQEEK